MSISKQKMERLVFIKELHRTAEDQAERPQPMASISIFSMHNAVELFLYVSAEHVGLQKSTRISFMDYWEEIDKKTPSGTSLPKKPSMERLNRARRNLKHAGNIPNKSDIDRFKKDVREFFEHSSNTIFGIGFEDIEMSTLIQNQKVIKFLDKSKKRQSEGNYLESVGEIGKAFESIIFQFNRSAKDEFGVRQEVQLGGNSRIPFFSKRDIDDRNMKEFVEHSQESIQSLQKELTVVGMGIDYRRYIKFNHMTPNILQAANGEYHVTYRGDRENSDYSDEDLDMLRRFVIDLTLSIEELADTLGVEITPPDETEE